MHTLKNSSSYQAGGRGHDLPFTPLCDRSRGQEWHNITTLQDLFFFFFFFLLRTSKLQYSDAEQQSDSLLQQLLSFVDAFWTSHAKKKQKSPPTEGTPQPRPHQTLPLATHAAKSEQFQPGQTQPRGMGLIFCRNCNQAAFLWKTMNMWEIKLTACTVEARAARKRQRSSTLLIKTHSYETQWKVLRLFWTLEVANDALTSDLYALYPAAFAWSHSCGAQTQVPRRFFTFERSLKACLLNLLQAQGTSVYKLYKNA